MAPAAPYPGTRARLRLTKEACPRTRNREADCRLCELVCPAGSLRIGIGRLEADSTCTRCMACYAVCPTGAIRSTSPSDRDLADRALSLPVPGFACRRAGLDPAHVTVQCLARVTAAVLLRLARKNAGAVRLIGVSCGECPDARARYLALDRSIATFREIRRVLSLPGMEIMEEEHGLGPCAEAAALSRREILLGLLPLLSDCTHTAGGALRSEVRRAEAPLEPIPLSHAPLGWPQVQGRCDGCGLCAHACPTGALEADRNGSFRLRFGKGWCAACGACASVCARGAIRVVRGLRGPPETREAETLVEVRMAECSRCGAPVPDGDETCAGCRRRYSIGRRT